MVPIHGNKSEIDTRNSFDGRESKSTLEIVLMKERKNVDLGDFVSSVWQSIYQWISKPNWDTNETICYLVTVASSWSEVSNNDISYADPVASLLRWMSLITLSIATQFLVAS